MLSPGNVLFPGTSSHDGIWRWSRRDLLRKLRRTQRRRTNKLTTNIRIAWKSTPRLVGVARRTNSSCAVTSNRSRTTYGVLRRTAPTTKSSCKRCSWRLTTVWRNFAVPAVFAAGCSRLLPALAMLIGGSRVASKNETTYRSHLKSNLPQNPPHQTRRLSVYTRPWKISLLAIA